MVQDQRVHLGERLRVHLERALRRHERGRGNRGAAQGGGELPSIAAFLSLRNAPEKVRETENNVFWYEGE